MSDENSELTRYYKWREKIEQDKKEKVEDEPESLRRIRDRVENVINGNEGT
jgi:hypothetical protein